MSSKQDWRTPPEFLAAVANRFGPISWDLAATVGEEVTTLGRSFTPEDDSLVQNWSLPLGPVRYLNPPFADIDPWAKKLSEQRDSPFWTLMLVPASVGSNWFREHVQGKLYTLGLNPRLTFLGATAPYPKDCVLICAGFGVNGFDTWRWK